MGPIALFDKSFLQALSVDEAVWFDRFLSGVVCPIFFVETLADLAKEPSKRGPAEHIVRELALKSPEMNGIICGFHFDLVISNLIGHNIPLDGRVPRPGGRQVKSGTVYEQSLEDLAFQRWERSEFYEVERTIASNWRRQLSEIDLSIVAREFRALGVDGKSCKTLQEAKDLAGDIVSGTQSPMSRFALAFSFFNIASQLHPQIFERWERTGRRPFNKFAPYVAFVLTIEVFFQIALAAGLIGVERVSNRTDIAYLFYLPFCMTFISQDTLHQRCAPLFMREDQRFAWGIDLKAALRSINLVAEMWDKHLRPGYREEGDIKQTAEAEAALVKKLKAFAEQPPLESGRPEDEKEVMIKRMVSKRRGSWWQLPKDLKETGDQD